MKVSALLADYGYSTMRLTDDWGSADFIAVHIDGSSLKVQLKSRLSVAAKYLGKGLAIAFRNGPPESGDWYLYPHDEICELLRRTKRLDRTQSWLTAESYRYRSLTDELQKMLLPYKISGKPSFFRPIPRSWLVRKLRNKNSMALEVFPLFQPLMIDDDELWLYDEPMPPDINAGELGIALVRNGTPIHSEMTGVH